MTRSRASVLSLLLFPSLLLAQIDPRENCDLSVRVVTPDERSVNGQVQVQLLSTHGESLATIHVSGGEPAEFHVRNGRTYRLTVSGAGFQTVTTSYFEINALEQNHSEIVHVKPDTKKQDEEGTSAQPTISISELNIPEKASAQMNKGLEEYSRGNMDKAAAHFEKAIAEYPTYARAYDMLGAIAIKASDRVKARERFSKAIQVDMTFFPAYLDLARMDLQDEQFAAAKSWLAKALAMNPSLPEAVSLLATAEFANKEYDKGLADVERTHALRNHEPFAEVHLTAGKVLRMQNHPEAAIVQFQLFLKEKPDSPLADSARQALASLQAGQQP